MERPSSEAASTAAHLARNAVDCLPAGALAERLAQGRPLRVKLGLDPTAPDIHLGHTVVLTKLREFQDAGHTVVLIVGDFTARVGDPSGRSATRPGAVGRGDRRQRGDLPAPGRPRSCARDERLEVRRNSEWLDMPMEDLFRLARHPTVAQLLERDDFAKRFAAAEPISLLELLYPVLQGYDSVCVRGRRRARRHRPDVQPADGPLDPAGLRAAAAGRAHGAAAHRHRRRAEDVEVVRQPRSASPSRRGRCTARRCGSRTSRSRSGTRCCSGQEPPAGVGPARRQARPRARARDAVPLRRRRPRRPRPASTASSSRTTLPEEIEEAVVRARERHGAPAGGDRARSFGRSRSEARRMLAQGGVRLDGEALAADALDLPAERARRARAAARQAAFPAARGS